MLDLLLKDIGKLVWAAGPIRRARKVVRLITNHHMAHALYSKHNKLEFHKPGMPPIQAILAMQSCVTGCGIEGKINSAYLPLRDVIVGLDLTLTILSGI